MDFLTDFYTEKYLKEYIKDGGSKIKFITGKKASGKTYFVKNINHIADGLDYKTVYFSANNIWLYDFSNIYLEIYRQCDILNVLNKCSQMIIKKMGYNPEDIPEGQTFMDYLASQGFGDALTRREIRLQLKNMFLDNPILDNNFALACSLLTGSILGHPLLEDQNKEILLSWLNGDKTVKAATIKALGLAPTKINKYNARHMLRSLAEVIHQSGSTGLVVAIDDMEALVNTSSLAPLHYTKMRREDTYESIRQLIDDIDSLHYVMFMFSFRRELIDDDNIGIKSYQALWMRIQNEVVSQRFNYFADIIDMDKMAIEEYKAEDLVKVSQEFIDAKNSYNAVALSIDEANTLLEKARLGNVGIPGLLEEKLFGGNNHE